MANKSLIGIACVDRQWKMPDIFTPEYYIQEHLDMIKRLTIGQYSLSGRRTFEYFAGHSPSNADTTLVMSTGLTDYECGIIQFMSVDGFLDYYDCLKSDSDICVCVLGGSKIFQSMSRYLDEVHLTCIDAVRGPAPQFPNLDYPPEPDAPRWHLGLESVERAASNGLRYRHLVYRNPYNLRGTRDRSAH